MSIFGEMLEKAFIWIGAVIITITVIGLIVYYGGGYILHHTDWKSIASKAIGIN
jgi:hypothetical protein